MRKKKIKLGFLIVSPNWAGAENALKNIVKSMSDLGQESIIYCNDEIYEHYVGIKNVKIYNLGKMNLESKLRYINYLKLKSAFNSSIKNSSPSILFPMLDVPFFITGGLRRYNFIIIPNLRGEEINNFINKKRNLTGFFLGRLLKRSSKIISVSKNQITGLSKKYLQKIKIIPNGVDSEKFKPINRIAQRKNVVLFVGRIKKEKGINEILEVTGQLPKYEFWFVGKGPLEYKLKGKNIKNLGPKNADELVQLYNLSTICISPSYREGFSNVGLENISCGRTLICTPPFTEYIENEKDGIIIPPKNSEALKNAIVDLMEDTKKRKRLEKAARKKALKYSWDNIAKEYISLCKQAIKEHNQKSLSKNKKSKNNSANKITKCPSKRNSKKTSSK